MAHLLVNIEKLLGTIEALREITGKEGQRVSTEDIPPSPLLTAPEQFFPVLSQHAQCDGNGRYIVTAPVTTLIMRAPITRDEAEKILIALSEKGCIRPCAELDAVELLDTQYVPKEGSVATTFDASGMSTSLPATPVPYLRRAQRPPRATHKDQKRIHKEPEGVRLTPHAPMPPTVRPALSLTEVYQHLCKRATLLSGRKLFRSPVPFLQTVLKIGPRDAVSILEYLVVEGHIIQLDEWRIIELRAVGVTGMLPAKVLPQASVQAPKPHHRVPGVHGTRSVMPKKPEEALQHTTDGPRTMDDVISFLEEQLVNLCDVRDDMVRRVAMFEASIVALRAARDAYHATEEGRSQCIEQFIRITKELSMMSVGGGA